MLRTTLLLLALAATNPLQAERVTFETEDKVTIVGDFHMAARDAGTVICLPMYRHERSSWEPLVKPLLAAGVNVLALDLRGHGESGREFIDPVKTRDAAVFNAMWRDVFAAVRFLEKRQLDPNRVALIGASVGCSVAVHSVTRSPGPFRAVVLMTPGANYLGVDTIEHAAAWPGTPLWILTSKEEEPKVAEVAQAFERWGEARRYEVVPGEKLHGTRMFGKVEGLEDRIVRHLAEHLGKEQTAIRVPRFPKGDPRVQGSGFFTKTLRIERHDLDAYDQEVTYTLMAYAVGDSVTLGAMVKGSFSGKVRFGLDEASLTFVFDTDDNRTEPLQAEVKGREGAAVSGYQAGFRSTRWISVELPAKEWFSKRTLLSLDFEPFKGQAPRIPSEGHRFAVDFVDM